MKKKQLMETEQSVEISVNTRVMVSVIILLLIAIIGGIWFFVFNHRNNTQSNSSQTINSKDEIKKLVAKVGILYDLPSGEDPTVATVSDKTKLAGQSFFARAENGDRVLIYTKAKKAILYRPVSNKIIEVAPINIADSSSSAFSSTSSMVPTQTPQVKIAISNGTKTSGLAAQTEKQITDKYTNMSVVSKSNAKTDYTKTIVVDLTGTNSASVQELVTLLGGVAGQLPAGETKSNADILVILGK